MNTELFTYFLTLMIFLARIIDVSIGTIRIIVVARGMKLLASVLGFLEVFIWLVAISQIIKNLASWEMYFFYAAGFATGTYVGMSIEQRLAFGNILVRIVYPGSEKVFDDYLRKQGYNLTHLEGHGKSGPVSIVFTVIKKNRLKALDTIIREFNPMAFYTIEDIRLASNGGFKGNTSQRNLLQPFFWFRKGK